MTNEAQLSPHEVLANVRPLVLVLGRDGVVQQAYGAAHGIAGYRSQDLVGRQSLDLVVDEDRLELMHVFAPGSNYPPLRNPSPFPVRVVGPAGERELVDLLPHGLDQGDGGWVLTVMPRREYPSPLKVLDLMLDGASLETVLRELVTHQVQATQEAHIDPHILIRPSNSDRLMVSPERNPISDALQTLVDARNDRLWRDVPIDETVELTAEQLPAILRLAADLSGFGTCTVTRIDLDGRLEAVMVTMIDDPRGTAMSGNIAINQRELNRIVRHAVHRDVADRRLRVAALQDALTGLSNRGRFDQLLNSFDGRDATLMFIDLDHFKLVNDEFGHRVGDEVLIEVANRLRRACRPHDVIARIGGDEFAVLLTDTDERIARSISGRLLQSIAAPLPPHLGPTAISASVGFARQLSPTNPAELLHAADRAMLSGKRAGRARVVIGD
jgi:diguanylate cyclase (GGDEF)-like protein